MATATVTAMWWLAVAAAALWAEGVAGRPQRAPGAPGRSYLPPEGRPPFNAPSDDADNLLAPPDQRDALPPFRTDQDSFRLDAQVELVGEDPPPRGRPGSTPAPGRAGTRTGDRSPEELFPDPAAYIPPPPSRLQDPAAAAGNTYLPPGAGAAGPAGDRDGFGGQGDRRPATRPDGFGGTRPSSDRDGFGGTRPSSDRDGFGGTRPSSDRDGFGGQGDRRPASRPDGFGGTRPSSDRDGFGGQGDGRPATRPDGFGGTRPNDQVGFVDQEGIRPTDRDGYGVQGATRPTEQDGFGGTRPSSDRDGYGSQGGTRPTEQDGYGGTRPSSDRDGFGVKGDRRPVTRPDGYGTRPSSDRDGYGGQGGTRPTEQDGYGGTRPSSDRDGYGIKGERRPVARPDGFGGTRPSSDRDGFGQEGTRPSNDLDGFEGQGDRRPDGFEVQGGRRPTTTQDAFGGQDSSNGRRPSPPPVRTDGQSQGSSGNDGQGLAGDRIPSSGAEGYPAANKPGTAQPGAGYGGQAQRPPQGSVTNFGGERPTEYGVNPPAGVRPSQGNDGYPPSNSRPGIEQPEFQDSSERPNQGFGGFQQSENIPSTPRPGQEGRPSGIAPNRPAEDLPARRPEGFQPTRGNPQGEFGTSGPQGRPEFDAPSTFQAYPTGPGGDANTFASNQRPSDGNAPFSPGSEDSYSPPNGQRPRPIPEYGPPRGGYGTDDTRERPAVRPQIGRPDVRPEGDGRYPTTQTNTYPSNSDPNYRPPAPNNEIGRPENGLASDGFTSGGDQGSDNRRPGNKRPSSRPDSNVDYPNKEQEGYKYDRPSSPGLTEPENSKYPSSSPNSDIRPGGTANDYPSTNQYPTRQDSDLPNQIPLSDVDQPLNADKYPQSSRPGSINPDFPSIGNQRPNSGIGSNAFASPSLAERPTSIGGVGNGYPVSDQSTASRPGGSTGYPSPSGGNRRPAGNDDVRKPIAPQQGSRPNARPDGEKRPQGNDRRPGGVGPDEFSSETGGYATANPDTPGISRPVLGGDRNGEAAYPRPGDSSRYPERTEANAGASQSKGYNYDRPTADSEFGERPISNGRPGYNSGTNLPSQNSQSEFVPSSPQPGFEPSRGNGVTPTFGTGVDSRRPGEIESYPDSSFGTRPGANSASDNTVSGPYGATNNGYNPGQGSSPGYGSGTQRPSVGNELGYPSATSRPGSEGSRPDLEGSRPGLGGSRPSLEGSTPSLEGSRPSLEGSRPGSDGSIPKEEGPYKYDIPSETLELQEGNRPRNSYRNYGGPSKGDSYSPDRLPAPSSGSSVTRPFGPDSSYGAGSSVASRREQVLAPQGNYKSARIISGETKDFGRASNDPNSNSNDAASLGSGASSENPGSPEQQAAQPRPDPETTLSGQPDTALPVQGRTSEQQGGSPVSRVPSIAAGLPVTPSDLSTGAVPSPRSRLPPAAVTGEDVKYEEAKYEFQYRVQEPPLAVDFGHHERRVEDLAQGEYFVLLPDGRTQVVEYEADNDGYKPVVRYGDEPPKIFTAGTPSSTISSASGSRVKGSYTPGGSRG